MKFKSYGDPYYYLVVAILGSIESLIYIYYFPEFIKESSIPKIVFRVIFILWISGYSIYFWMRYKKEKLKRDPYENKLI